MADSKENYLWDRRGEKIQLKHQPIQESFINDPTVAMTSDFSLGGGGGRRYNFVKTCHNIIGNFYTCLKIA